MSPRRCSVPRMDTPPPPPTPTTTCRCGATVELASWWANACPRCGTEFNGAGQRLRSGWRDNASLYDENVGDLEGYELSRAGD